MTVGRPAGASSTAHHKTWPKLPWSEIEVHVFRLQMRIAKAEREGRKSKAKALQRLLTSSFYAKCLAVKRVTSNKGGKTPALLRICRNYSCVNFEPLEIEKQALKNSFNSRKPVASSFGYFYFIIHSFNKTAVLSLFKVIDDVRFVLTQR